MLPRASRLRDSRQFAIAVRDGQRGKSGLVVVYLQSRPQKTGERPWAGGARIGLIVNKHVGNSVKRHRVSRILRHRVAEIRSQLPQDSVIVIRALPGSYEHGSSLGSALRSALAIALNTSRPRRPAPSRRG